MFIGRERELKSLEQLYASNKFEFVVLYGRRRVGKTALLTQFIQGKKAIYFMGVESNAKQNLENLSKSILEYASGIEADTSFLSFQAALIAVGAINGLVAIGIYGLFRAPGLTREEDRLKKEALERKNSRGAKDAGVEKTRGNALTEFISVLKMPILWLNVAATMTMTFYNQVVFTYMNPYLVNVLGIAAATASLLQITFRNSLRIVISPFGGTIRDKLNDSTAVVKWFSFGLAAVMLCFALFGAASLYAYLALVVLAGICIYSVTGLQYTLIADAKVPIKYSGRVWGIVFGLNTLTTLFRGTVCGSLLDIQGVQEWLDEMVLQGLFLEAFDKEVML